MRPVLTYVWEIFPLRAGGTKRFLSFHRWCLSSMAKLKFSGHVSNPAVRQHCVNVEQFPSFLDRCSLKWLRDVLRQLETVTEDYVTGITLLRPVLSSWWSARGVGYHLEGGCGSPRLLVIFHGQRLAQQLNFALARSCRRSRYMNVCN